MAIKVSGTTVISDSRALENITDIPNLAKAVSIESPTNGSTDSGSGPVLTIDVSQYQAIFGVSAALHIQIDNNSDFSSPLYDVEKVTSGSDCDIDTRVYTLPTSTVLYVRARYKDGDGAYTTYSPTVSFTTRSSFDYIIDPVITSPSAGDEVSHSSLQVTTASFATSAGSYTHTSSDWQISTDSSFTNVVEQLIASSTAKTIWNLSSTLSYSTVYYIRVRFNSSQLGTSEYSTAVQVSTGAQPGENVYTTPGTYSWVAPSTTSISVVAIGGGGGGVNNVHDNCGAAGGACSWINNYSAAEGTGYALTVGAGGPTGGGDGQDSLFVDSSVCKAGGGFGAPGSGNNANSLPIYVTDRVGDGGGDGGGLHAGSRSGAGGAGGYTGQGGVGQETDTIPNDRPASGGAGGAGYNINNFGGCAGGGVGIFGEGTTGASGNTSTQISGFGGSGGQGGFPQGGTGRHTSIPHGGAYGGGAGSKGSTNYGPQPPQGGVGGDGAVRIMWGGGRSFPNNADAT